MNNYGNLFQINSNDRFGIISGISEIRGQLLNLQQATVVVGGFAVVAEHLLQQVRSLRLPYM